MSILTEGEINEIADKCKSSLGGVWPHAFYEVAEAMILAKLAGMELPEPINRDETEHGTDYYTATQLRQAYAQGAASVLSAEPVAQWNGEFLDVDAPTEYEKSLGWEPLYALKHIIT